MKNLYRLLATIIGVFTVSASFSQTYPNRPIRLVVPFPPGGGSDYIARLIQPELSKSLKQQVVVDNKGGAGGTIGTEMVARAAPDGYTLGLGSVATHPIAGALYPKLAYDPLKDFTPIVPIGSMPHILVVHPSLGVKSAQELIALAKQKPGQLNYASAGNGSVGHLTMELFKTMAGIDIRHIPYRGSGPALTDVVGGQVQIMFDTLPTGLPFVKSGTLLGLAVSSNDPAPAAPDIPPLSKSGVPGFEVLGWYGLFAPKGTPMAIIERLNKEVTRITASPALQEKMKTQGAQTMSATVGEFENYVKAESEKWAKVVRDSDAGLE